MNPVPRVVIVGRPNVGKSSLLNMLARRRISIVDPTAGVTRDRISAIVEVPISIDDPQSEQSGGVVEIVDTGGYGVEDVQNLTPMIERQIATGLAGADLVLLVIDAQSGVVPLDRQVARLVRSSGGDKSVLVLANKVDGENQQTAAQDAAALGFGEPLMISAKTGYQRHLLYEAIRTRLTLPLSVDEAAARASDEGIRIAVVGKRNAGKSTLVNALCGEERVLVSEQEGTTRDAVDVRLEVDGEIFTLIDTAGLRRRKSVQDDVEYYATHRALRSIRRADVCLFVIDAQTPISQVDRQLMNEIVKHHRPTVLVVNKWDQMEATHDEDDYAEYLDRELKGLSFAPITIISALKQTGVRDALAMAHNLYQQAGHRVSTGTLNQIIQEILTERGPSAKGGKRAKIYYATQVEVHPPTIVMSVNAPELFETNNYQRFLLNRLRDQVPYSEVPIELIFRGKDRS